MFSASSMVSGRRQSLVSGRRRLTNAPMRDRLPKMMKGSWEKVTLPYGIPNSTSLMKTQWWIASENDLMEKCKNERSAKHRTHQGENLWCQDSSHPSPEWAHANTDISETYKFTILILPSNLEVNGKCLLHFSNALMHRSWRTWIQGSYEDISQMISNS